MGCILGRSTSIGDQDSCHVPRPRQVLDVMPPTGCKLRLDGARVVTLVVLPPGDGGSAGSATEPEGRAGKSGWDEEQGKI